jgi:hypothetical protein
MKNAILIPTYSEHFQFNLNFLDSLDRFCCDGGMPMIFFITSTAEEAKRLSALLEPMKAQIKANSLVLDVESDFIQYAEHVERTKSDMDSPRYFLNGRSGIVNLKKLAGLERVFSLGYDNVVVLDSEVLLFRETNLLQAIDEYVSADIYRYSIAARNHELMAKIQYDSIRSVVWSFDNRHYFARSYGWYENLCVYNQEKFSQFLQYLSAGDEKISAKGGYAACHLKAAAFEWISYMAYRTFVLQDDLNGLCVDESIISVRDGNIIMNAQNENLYQYLTGDDDQDINLLSSVNPPWVPYTENDRTRALLEKSLPQSCCLMFHVDRKHPGAEQPVVETRVEVETYVEKVSTMRRCKNLVKRFIIKAGF